MTKWFVNGCVAVSISVWIVLFALSLVTYEGSTVYYVLFTGVFSALLLSAFINPPCYSYLFLAVMLWLGFWLKFTYHTIFHLPYQEEIGSFLQTPASLDQVLLIASMGCIGVLFARWIYARLKLKSNLLPTIEGNLVPFWYQKSRHILLPLLVVFMFVMTALNFWLGIFHVGVVTKTILIWPLNALIGWLLTSGFALIVSTVIWWDVKQKRSLVSLFVCAVLESFTMSVTILSRALYIFHTASVATAWFTHRRQAVFIGYKKIIGLSILTVVLFITSLQSVTILRAYYFDGMPLHFELHDLKTPAFVGVFNQLVLNRWLGVEGVMAASSYEDKGWSTFHEALVEKSEIGKVGIYQKIARSHYQTIDANRFLFGTLPGMIGFLYISGSLLVVFMGAFMMTFIMMLGENLVFLLTRNPFLCTLFAITAANTVAQFGVAPRMIFKQYLLIYGYLLFVHCLQNRYYATLLTKLKFGLLQKTS